jgi:DNA-binding NtrC family response regulator
MARLLIVEDDVITAVALHHAVTRMGHQVVARTTSAADAMAAVQAYCPDAVLLDIRLAGAHNGVLVGTDIQALWSIPVIYLSGSDPALLGIPDFPEALWCYLAKPIHWDQLRDLLAQLFPSQPPHAIRRTAQELREQLRALRAHLAALQRHQRQLQRQTKETLATAEALAEDAKRLRRPADPADAPPESAVGPEGCP